MTNTITLILGGTQKSCSCVEAGHVQPSKADAPAHDSSNRRLTRKEPHTEDLAPGWRVYLKGYGFVKVFRTVSPNGDVERFYYFKR